MYVPNVEGATQKYTLRFLNNPEIMFFNLNLNSQKLFLSRTQCLGKK